MLNMRKVKPELFKILTCTYSLKKVWEGGVSYNSNRNREAWNKYLKSFDPKQESKHIIYLDANNLYGYAMSKFFPTSAFKWIDPKEIDMNKYTSISLKRWVFQADLQYPEELLKLCNDYSLAPDKIEIREIMSDYQLKIADHYSIPIGNVKKWVSNFFNTEK